MTNMKSTKRALLSSVLALFLCFSMLLGTTFAWFTDSVTSGNNIIQSGNLDIELKYKKVVNGQITADWDTVQGKDEIFDPEALWEPGRVEVVYLEISNVGSLALKYQLGVNVVDEVIGTNVLGGDLKLSDHLVFKVIEIDEADVGTYTRETAMAAAGTEKGLADYNGATTALEVGGKDYVALIVYMPTSVGNEANHNGTAEGEPSITLGINLFATHVSSEEDSFGKDYDEDAIHEQFKVLSATDLQNALNNATAGSVITLMDDIDVNESITVSAPSTAAYSLRRSALAGITIDLNGKTMSSVNGLEDPVIYSKGVLTLKNGTIKAVETTAIRNHGSSAYLTLEGMTITQTTAINPEWLGSAVFTSGGATTEIHGGTYTGVSSAAIVATSGGHLIINDGTFSADVTTIRIDTWSYNSFLTINDGTFNVSVEGAKALYADGYKAADGVNINGGTFNGTIDSTYTLININGGTFTKSIKQSGGHQNYYNISGGSFVEDVSAISKNTTIPADRKAVETDNGWIVINSDQNYVADGVLVSEDGKTYYISSRAGYEWVDAQTDTFFGNKTIQLTADIDFGGDTITGIKFWNSHPTFDGQGYALSNFVIGYSGSKSPSGLFYGTFDAKNLVVDGANVSGDYAGGISGWMYGNIDNCTVKNSTITSTYWQGGGLAGQYNQGNVTNSTVENCTVSGGSAIGGLIGILNETAGVRKVENCAVKNCEIIAKNGFGGVYDTFFGAAVGLINIENSEIYFNGCSITGTTVKGEASTSLYGGIEDGTSVYVNGALAVSTAEELQTALNNGAINIVFVNDITGDVTIAKKADVDITIDGNGKTFTGVATIIGNADTGSLTVKNVDFVAASGKTVIIDVPQKYNNGNANNYVKNVTIDTCTFTDPDGDRTCVAVSHSSGGKQYWTLKDCTVDETMHSFLQASNIEKSLVIDGCKVYSKNGINVNYGTVFTMTNCEFDVTGYAVRFSVKGATVNGTFTIADSTLKSANDDGDAVIIFRGEMSGSTLTLTNTTLVGTPDVTGNATVIK